MTRVREMPSLCPSLFYDDAGLHLASLLLRLKANEHEEGSQLKTIVVSKSCCCDSRMPTVAPFLTHWLLLQALLVLGSKLLLLDLLPTIRSLVLIISVHAIRS